MIKLKDLVVDSEILVGKDKKIYDKVYVKSSNDLNSLNSSTRLKSANDYALACGARQYNINGKNGSSYVTRTTVKDKLVNMVIHNGEIREEYIDCLFGNVPCFAIDMQKFLRHKELNVDYIVFPENHSIKFEEFKMPVRGVSKEKAEQLNVLLSQDLLRETGKKFIGYEVKSNMPYDGFNKEYLCNGKLYVNTKVNPMVKDLKLNNGEVYNSANLWCRVESSEFIIKNWDEMPIIINPNGSGSAETLNLESAQVLNMILFAPNFMTEGYENSNLRRYNTGLPTLYKDTDFLSEMDHSEVLMNLKIDNQNQETSKEEMNV